MSVLCYLYIQKAALLYSVGDKDDKDPLLQTARSVVQTTGPTFLLCPALKCTHIQL